MSSLSETSTASTGGTPQTPGPKILIVDDDSDMLRLADWLVKDLWPGAEVFFSKDGDRAIRLLYEQRPDLLVTDIRIPGPSGMELGRLVRETSFLSHTKVLAMTGFHDPQTHADAVLLGADQYLSKPFEPQEFVRAMLRLLGRDRFPIRPQGEPSGEPGDEGRRPL